MEAFLKAENILDASGKILDKKGLSKNAYDRFRNTNLDLTTNQINDCLQKLNVKLNLNPILNKTSNKGLYSEVLLDKIACMDNLIQPLKDYGVMNDFGTVINPDGLLNDSGELTRTRPRSRLSYYDKIAKDLKAKDNKFTLNILDDCLNKLNITIPS